MDGPYLRIEDSGEVIPLAEAVTTIGRGSGVDIHLSDPSVSRLHAEIVRRGPYAYVTDLGLSRNGTRVNGRLVARRVLEDGDVLTFGNARCRVGGIPGEDLSAEVELRRSPSPELTRRELDVLTSLCRPALSDEAFVAPGHRPGDRRRPGGDRGGGEAAPAPAVPEVPHSRGHQPPGQAGQRGGVTGPGPAAAASRPGQAAAAAIAAGPRQAPGPSGPRRSRARPGGREPA